MLVWARSRAGQPGRYDAWARVGANAPVKLNLGGQGQAGGVDYPTVVYQRILNGQSNLYLYDLSDDTRPSTPPGVNTGKWEYLPSISGDWLLFGRDDNRGPSSESSSTTRTPPSNGNSPWSRGPAIPVWPGQVNGNWAVYTRCTRVGCNVILYDIAGNTKTTLPKPSSREQYSPSVTSTGTVYLVRSGRACGANARIVRYGPADPATGTVLAQLPNRRDAGFASVRENPDGSVDFFYSRFNCRTTALDVYKLNDPAPGP